MTVRWSASAGNTFPKPNDFFSGSELFYFKHASSIPGFKASIQISDCNHFIRYSDCQDLEDMDSTYSSSEDDTLEVHPRTIEQPHTIEQPRTIEQ